MMTVPELGPALGRLTVPGPGPLAAARLRLATAVFDAAARARQEGDPAPLAPAAWRAMWEDAVGEVTTVLVQEAEANLHAAAAEARLPGRRWSALTLTEVERHGIAARLGAEGAHLLRTVDRLGAEGPLDAEAVVRAARTLDASWGALERAAGEERARWQVEAMRVRAWRRPRWPLAVGAGLLVLLLGWLGLALGGWLPAPGPLARLQELITALP